MTKAPPPGGRRKRTDAGPCSFSAPTRIDLAGGTLDIWPVGLLLPRAVTVNVAIDLRARATVRRAARFQVAHPGQGLDLEADSVKPLFDHPFAVLAARLTAFFEPPWPVAIHLETRVPPGSGLGGSSSLGVAIAGALNALCGAGWTPLELVRIVMDTEVRILETPTGAQDQLAAAFGGARAHHWETPNPRSEPLPWASGGRDPLAERFVLVYTGEAHSSADPNGSVLHRIWAGEPKTLGGVRKIGEAAVSMREALLARDFRLVAEALDREWEGRRALGEAVVTPTLERFETALRRAGALAVKACGAGGGGTLIAITTPESREAVAEAARGAGGQVLDARSDPEGLREEPPDP